MLTRGNVGGSAFVLELSLAFIAISIPELAIKSHQATMNLSHMFVCSLCQESLNVI